MKELLNTREVAEYLDVHEKRVYALVTERGLPGTKITGKWLFPKRLVDLWLERSVENLPAARRGGAADHLVIAGSDDPLLARIVRLFMRGHDDPPRGLSLYAPIGSLAGLEALRRGWCQVTPCHVLDAGGETYNRAVLGGDLAGEVALYGFARREQVLAVAKENPRRISSIRDLAGGGVRIVNRARGTGTRILFDEEMRRAGLKPAEIAGYDTIADGHLEAAFSVFLGEADAGLCVRAAAEHFGLDCVPVRTEQFHLAVRKRDGRDEKVAAFLNFFRTDAVRSLAARLGGYDLSLAGEVEG